MFQRKASDTPRPPTGGPRNTHFPIWLDRLDEAFTLLDGGVGGRVFTREGPSGWVVWID